MKYCPTCGKVVPRGHGYKTSQIYCSRKCYEDSGMATVEKQQGKPVRQAVINTLNSNQNITVTANLLGIDKPQLYNWMDKLGIKKVLYWE